MNVLALDTSTEFASVALAIGEDIRCLEQHTVRQHAQQLLPMVQTLLCEAGVTWTALDGIVFGAGPGSFTGLRIACSVAKAFAYPHEIPLYGVCTLDVIADQARFLAKDSGAHLGILAILDARMQEVYWAYYPPGTRFQASSVVVTAPEAVVVPRQQPFMIAGLGFETYKARWPKAVLAASDTHRCIAPSATAAIRLVQLGQCNAMTAADVMPLYVRDQVTHSGGTRG